jgi:hypothetical protein
VHLTFFLWILNFVSSIIMFESCILSSVLISIWFPFCVTSTMFLCANEKEHLIIMLPTFQDPLPKWTSLFIEFGGVRNFGVGVLIGVYIVLPFTSLTNCNFHKQLWMNNKWCVKCPVTNVIHEGLMPYFRTTKTKLKIQQKPWNDFAIFSTTFDKLELIPQR